MKTQAEAKFHLYIGCRRLPTSSAIMGRPRLPPARKPPWEDFGRRASPEPLRLARVTTLKPAPRLTGAPMPRQSCCLTNAIGGLLFFLIRSKFVRIWH
jgi:hypothetical protein